MAGTGLLGIYGGTFDPIHYGHLRTGLEVKEALHMQELRFLPCRQPPHRGVPGASPQQRLTMLELALADAGPGFAVDHRELERDGPSYMVDTLASLRKENPGTPLCLIVGLDAFYGFPNWHRWRDLFRLAHIAVMQRPDAPPAAWAGALAEALGERLTENPGDLLTAPAGRVMLLEVTQLAISATGIRQLLSRGKSPRYLLPDPVLRMIETEGLYRAY